MLYVDPYKTLRDWEEKEYLRIMRIANTELAELKIKIEMSNDYQEIKQLCNNVAILERTVRDFMNHKPEIGKWRPGDDMSKMKYFLIYGTEIIDMVAKGKEA